MEKKNFISAVLEHKGINKNQAAKALGWTPQYIGYLCRDAKLLNTSDIPHICSCLQISKITMMKLLKEIIFGK